MYSGKRLKTQNTPLRHKPYPSQPATDLHRRANEPRQCSRKAGSGLYACAVEPTVIWDFTLQQCQRRLSKLKMSKIGDCATETSAVYMCWFHEQQVYTAQRKAYLLSPPTVLSFAKNFTAAVLFR